MSDGRSFRQSDQSHASGDSTVVPGRCCPSPVPDSLRAASAGWAPSPVSDSLRAASAGCARLPSMRLCARCVAVQRSRSGRALLCGSHWGGRFIRRGFAEARSRPARRAVARSGRNASAVGRRTCGGRSVRAGDRSVAQAAACSGFAQATGGGEHLSEVSGAVESARFRILRVCCCGRVPRSSAPAGYSSVRSARPSAAGVGPLAGKGVSHMQSRCVFPRFQGLRRIPGR